MALSKLCEICQKCQLMDICDNKRMEHVGYIDPSLNRPKMDKEKSAEEAGNEIYKVLQKSLYKVSNQGG